MNRPIISVIVPVYNVEKHLWQCVESILMQSWKLFELILVDDGSSDNSGVICDEFVQRDSRVKAVHKDNHGVSSARNTGIEIARGNYLTFIDSDDTIEENFFSDAFAQIGDRDLLISGIMMDYYRNGKKINQLVFSNKETKVYDVRTLLEDMEISYPSICISSPCCKLYKRSLIVENEIRFDVDMNLGEDENFNLDYLNAYDDMRVFFSKDCYYHYRRIDDNSLFSIYNKNTFFIHSKICDKMLLLMSIKRCTAETQQRYKINYYYRLLESINHEFSHIEESNKSLRCLAISRVAAHEIISQIKNNDIKGKKGRLLLWLFQQKWHAAIYVFFFIGSTIKKILKNFLTNISENPLVIIIFGKG